MDVSIPQVEVPESQRRFAMQQGLTRTTAGAFAERNGWHSRVVNAGGARIHLVEAGEGPLVLLCHGFPESWYSWRHQIEALADAGYRVAALDMRGYGRSAHPERVDEYRLPALVADCVGVVEALGATNAVIVGHDWGAPVAWTSAWTRPDVFRAAVGLSVPFGGRAVVSLPTISTFGDLRPSVVHRYMAGGDPDVLFYQELFGIPGAVEAEAEENLREWLLGIYYSFSASPPPPSDFAAMDLSKPEQVLAMTQASPACIRRGRRMRDGFAIPEHMPAWLTDEDIDIFVAELEYTGLSGALNYYRCLDLDWELLAPYEGRPVAVPTLFIGGSRDVATLWGLDALARAGEYLSDLRGAVILDDCGHWVQQEKPTETSEALLRFLAEL
jgi:pimeloyl-ACP methyl ester carboxylesterase